MVGSAPLRASVKLRYPITVVVSRNRKPVSFISTSSLNEVFPATAFDAQNFPQLHRKRSLACCGTRDGTRGPQSEQKFADVRRVCCCRYISKYVAAEFDLDLYPRMYGSRI
jgi:hypothetical protein